MPQLISGMITNELRSSTLYPKMGITLACACPSACISSTSLWTAARVSSSRLGAAAMRASFTAISFTA